MTSQLIYWLEYIVNFTGTIAYVFFLYLLIRRFLILRSERKLFILASFLMLTTLSGPIIYPEELTGTISVLFLFLLYLLIFFKGKILERVSVCIVLYPILVILNFITENIGFQIWLANRDMSPLAQTALHSFTTYLRIPAW